jgi:hypothetical protein
MPYLKPVLAGLLASAYLCFLTWLPWKAVSLVKEQGATGLIGITGAQPYVLHSPSFCALAIIACGAVFSYFVTYRSAGSFLATPSRSTDNPNRGLGRGLG